MGLMPVMGGLGTKGSRVRLVWVRVTAVDGCGMAKVGVGNKVSIGMGWTGGCGGEVLAGRSGMVPSSVVTGL